MNRRELLFILLVALLLVGGWMLLRTLSDTEAARLATLRPEARDAFERLRSHMAGLGVQMYVVSGTRNDTEQAAKVAAGQSGTGDRSWHLLGRAVDFNVGIRDPSTGKMRPDHKAENVADYRKVFEYAPLFGLKGIPNGSPFKPDGSRAYIKNAAGDPLWDVYHLEYTEGLTFAQAASRDRARSGVAT